MAVHTQIVAALALLALAGCARSAPQLPTENRSGVHLSAVEQGATCEDISFALRGFADEAKGYGATIQKERASNQVAGYFGALFIIPLVAVRQNTEEKHQLDGLQARWDRWINVAKAKQCPFDRTLALRGE